MLIWQAMIWLAAAAVLPASTLSENLAFLFAIGTPDAVPIEQPWDVAESSGGNIVIADTGGQQILIYSASGDSLSSFGSHGSGDGQFDHPRGVAVDDIGSIFVCDTENHRVQVFDGAGAFSFAFAEGLVSPRRIDVDAQGRIYVTDGGTKSVRVFDDTGAPLSAVGPFEAVFALELHGPDDLYVVAEVDSVNDWQVVVFDSTHSILRNFLIRDPGDPIVAGPSGVAVDDAGRIYVADGGMNRVRVFDSSGGLIQDLGTPGHGNGEFGLPRGVEIASSGRLWVADTDNDRVQVFGGFVKALPMHPAGFVLVAMILLATGAGALIRRYRLSGVIQACAARQPSKNSGCAVDANEVRWSC